MNVTSTRRIDDGLAAAPVFDDSGGALVLLGSACPRCGAVAFPRRAVCIRCGGPQEPAQLSGAGRLHSWTRLANPPAGFEGELLYGCVDLDEGPRVLAQLGMAEEDSDEPPAPAIGARVQAVAAPARDGAEGFRFEVRDA